MATRRTRSISTKVTDAEYEVVARLAAPLTISEWARSILLGTAQPDPIAVVVVAEMLAVRMILLNLHFALANGDTVTRDQMQTIIDLADQKKWSKAHARLEVAKSVRPPGVNSGGSVDGEATSQHPRPAGTS
jgi:hypothetical protein